MRLRSLMTLFFICLTALGLTGCGGSDTSTEFVATNPAQAVNVGDLTFNFVTAQQAYTVPVATTRLRFEFFENAGALGNPVVNSVVAFQPTITVQGLPTTIQAVRITGLDADNVPLFTINQGVTVVGGQNTSVAAVGEVVPVTLVELQLVSSDSVAGAPLQSVVLEVGGTGQVFLLAEFSNGNLVILGNAAQYSNDPNDPDSAAVLQIGTRGELRGLSPGQTNLIAEYAGQSLTIPVEVQAQLQVTFSSINFVNPDPLDVASGSSAQLALTGVRASDNFLFGISSSNTNLTYQVAGDPGISVGPTGLVSVLSTTPGGSQATITATYLNANGTTVSDTLGITVSGEAGVDTITTSVNNTNLFTGVPVFTSQIAIQENLTDGTNAAGDPTNYSYSPDDPTVVSVSNNGVITPVGAGVAVVTVSLNANPTVTDTVTVTVESAAVNTVTIEPPTPSVNPGQSQTFQIIATLSNPASTQIDVTALSGFTLSGAGAGSFSVAENVVTALGTATTGDQATVTGSFDPDGGGALPSFEAATTITTL